MRPINRIKPFLKWLEEVWEENQDQRFGQLLINLGIIEDNFKDWNKEISDYQIPFEYLREIQTWGTFGWKRSERNNLLKRYKQVHIKDLDFDHIIKILQIQKYLSPYLRRILETELSFRLSNEQ